MTKHVLLNNTDHKDIKIHSKRSKSMGDNVWYAQTFLKELRTVQAHYPIMFQKDATTGLFIPVVLFGFKNDENLFLKEDKWDCPYIPMTIQREPFYIGFQEFVENGVTEKQRVITLDIDSPKVNTSEGNALFLEFGGNSDFLEHMANVLETLHFGLQENIDFIAALTTCELLESVTLDIELKDGSNNQLLGFYTINEDKLDTLLPESITRLHQAGFLQAIYMVIASQAHINDLVARKNDLLSV